MVLFRDDQVTMRCSWDNTKIIIIFKSTEQAIQIAIEHNDKTHIVTLPETLCLALRDNHRMTTKIHELSTEELSGLAETEDKKVIQK